MDQKAFPQRVLQYIPTVGKLKRLYAQTRPAAFSVSGSHALFVVGLLLCVIGIQAFSHSQVAVQGPRAAGAPGQATGAVAVGVSAQQAPSPVAAANAAPSAGGVARSASLFLVVIGLLVALKPHILYYELRRMGLANGQGGERAGTAG
jgi:hypothetical protein